MNNKALQASKILTKHYLGRLSDSFTRHQKSEVSLTQIFAFRLDDFNRFLNNFCLSSDIVDKTANFVARNGPEFESRIQQSEKGNKKFTFLNSGDPYHLYYQFKVREFREGNVKDINVLPGLQKLSVSSAAQQKQQELLKQATEAQFVPREPPAEFEFVADPPSISALDLDVVKLTAQFVARNGRQFLTNLMNREQRNFQFDFLRPQHALFQYFTKLLEQYTKILIPPKELLPKLKQECETDREGQTQILDQVKYRANWQKHQDAARRREEEMIERERVAYAQIDWHDFVVVEVVDYQPYETGNFPAPTTPDEVGARVLMEQRLQEDDDDIEMQIESDEEIDQQAPSSGVKLSTMENRVRDNIQVQDMDETNSDDDASVQPSVAPLMPPTHDKVIVKKYDPKQVQKIGKPIPASEEYLISPITGEKIPASKVAEHMRIGLLDPRWVEQRDKLIEKVREETVFAPGSDIEASLKQLAERRTDIFGVGDEEAAIGKKLGEEEPRKDDRVTWDGHTSSVEAATRAAARNISLEDQIHQIHKQKGLLQDEEKEKIGPKPAISAPPKPSIHPPMNLPGQIPHHSAPPMPPPQMMMNQMNLRSQQVPPMRPPPMIREFLWTVYFKFNFNS